MTSDADPEQSSEADTNGSEADTNGSEADTNGSATEADAPNGSETPIRAPPEKRSPAALLRFGVVNLDKPPGPSSHQVSAWLRDEINDALTTLAPSSPPIDGVAHAGTLDPKVTGCLPTLTGTATRAAQAFLEGDKEYVSVLELHDTPPADFRDVVGEFETEIYQKPPKKSAVSRRLRTREIFELDVLEVDDRQALLRIGCESGTYIRKLCHDLGLACGIGAHMGDLRRTATDPFDDTDLHTLEDLWDALAWAREGDDDYLREVVRPAEDALTHLPGVTIAPSAASEVATGAQVFAPGVIELDDAARALLEEDGTPKTDATDALVACYVPNGSVVCLGRLVGNPDAESGTVVSLERVLL